MQFQLRTASLIVFGPGESAQVPELIAPWGDRVLVCTGKGSLQRGGHLEPLLQGLAQRGLHVTRFVVDSEPDTAMCDAAAALCRESGSKSVLAIGGGSVLDIGKAVAALATQPAPAKAIDFLEDVGRGKPRALTRPSLPMCAVPTTAGSGSEVTRNAVLRVPELSVKRSMRSDLMLPRIALVDPTLSADAPLKVAAAAGMDALTHLIEGYVSRGAQPTTDALARRGMELMFSALCVLAKGTLPRPAEAAADLALGSLWGGMVLANAGLGAVHGLVAPLGGLCGVAHGDGCACLLPATFLENSQALQRRSPGTLALTRYREMAALFAGSAAPAAYDADALFHTAAGRLQMLRSSLGVPSLAEQGVGTQHLPAIIAQSRGGSMRYNPVELSDAELERILQASLSPQQP